MPRKKREDEEEIDEKEADADDEEDEDDDEEEAEEEEKEEIDAANRDYLMARVGAALASAKAVVEACTDFLAICVNPDDDKKGKERKQLIADALEAAGSASAALDDAEGCAKQINPAAFTMEEPWEE